MLEPQASKDFCVQLENYSGPLDLLLQLIRKQEMDVFAIDISQITDHYVEHLKQSQELDLDKAGDFIRMASLLIYIKSRSLLPKQEQEEEQEDIHKLKERLSSLLATYQKFQKLGELLFARSLLGRDCWKSPRSFEYKAPVENKILIDKEKGCFQLGQFYYQKYSLQKARQNYQLSRPIPSLLSRLKQTLSFFKTGLKLKFHHLTLVNKQPYSYLLSFLSVLELSRAGFVSLFQKSLFTPIEILVKKPITTETLAEISKQNPEGGLA